MDEHPTIMSTTPPLLLATCAVSEHKRLVIGCDDIYWVVLLPASASHNVIDRSGLESAFGLSWPSFNWSTQAGANR